MGSSNESEEGKETEVINRMKEDEEKKSLEYFSPFFFIQHISTKKKKKVPQLEKSFIHMSSSPIFTTPQQPSKGQPITEEN